MISIRKLNKSDEAQLTFLLDETEKTLIDKHFWLPINEEARKHFLDDEWCYFLGAFDGDKLVAASCLFLNEHEYKESQTLINLPTNVKTAEIGRSMVLKNYRGNNLLYAINKKLIEKAKELSIKNIIVTIHPQNIASIKSFAKIGAEFILKTVKCEEYDRNIYLIKL